MQDTGPSVDGSGHADAYYLLMDSSNHDPGDKAVLLSRPLSHGFSDVKCLSFRYHMYGKCSFSNVKCLSFRYHMYSKYSLSDVKCLSYA